MADEESDSFAQLPGGDQIDTRAPRRRVVSSGRNVRLVVERKAPARNREADKGYMWRKPNCIGQRTPVMFAARLLLAIFALALCAATPATGVDFSGTGQVPPLPPKPPTAEATDNEPGSAPDPDSSLVTRRPAPESGGGSGATFAPAAAGTTGPCDAFLSLPDEAEPAVGAPCGCNRDQGGREVNLMVWQSVDPHVCVDA